MQDVSHEAHAGAAAPRRSADAQEPASRLAHEVLHRLFTPAGVRESLCVRFELWDGTVVHAGAAGATARATLRLRSPGTLRAWMLRTDALLGFAEAYLDGHLDIEGDFEHALALLDRARRHARLGALEKLRLAARLAALPSLPSPSRAAGFAPGRARRHSTERDRDAVAFHYDVGNEFFATFLDRSLGYTAARFESDDDDFDVAWQRKYAAAARKLEVRDGDRVADIGCGWGGFVAHVARHHDVRVLGVTISRRQVEWAQRVLREEGLAPRASVEYRHVRELEGDARFDKITAFQCTEHMDEHRLTEFFERMWRLLPPGGLLLVEFMTARVRLRAHPFFDRYVFPDGQQFPLTVPLSQAEGVGFELVDVEHLREDYLRTIRAWNRRLAQRRDRCEALVGPIRYRIWRLYLEYAAYGYARSRFNCYQCVWRKTTPGEATRPWRRPIHATAE